jgi:hypothetical protein
VILDGRIVKLAINHALLESMFSRRPEEAAWKSSFWKSIHKLVIFKAAGDNVAKYEPVILREVLGDSASSREVKETSNWLRESVPDLMVPAIIAAR